MRPEANFSLIQMTVEDSVLAELSDLIGLDWIYFRVWYDERLIDTTTLNIKFLFGHNIHL